MADIFISYASENLSTARAVSEGLAQLGWSVWWDRKIPLGQRFDVVIAKQLASARCVIVLWSQASCLSHWVIEEAADARDRQILVPARIEAVQAPLGFRSLQAADLTNWTGDTSDRAFRQLVDDISAFLGAPLVPPSRSEIEDSVSSASLDNSQHVSARATEKSEDDNDDSLKNNDIRYNLNLTLEEVFAGKTVDIQVTVARRLKTLRVNIPQGLEDGTRIRLAGEGEIDNNNRLAGDLYIYITILPHLYLRERAQTFIVVFLLL